MNDARKNGSPSSRLVEGIEIIKDDLIRILNHFIAIKNEGPESINFFIAKMNMCISCQFVDYYYNSELDFDKGHKLLPLKNGRQLLHIIHICGGCLLVKNYDRRNIAIAVCNTIKHRDLLLLQLRHHFHGKRAKCLLIHHYFMNNSNPLTEHHLEHIIFSMI